MPNEMTSASESNSTPNSLVGAGQPRDAAVEHVEDDGEADERRGRLELAAHRVDDAGVAAEHVAHREQAGQQVDAAAEPALRGGRSAGAGNADAPQRGFGQPPSLQCSTAMTVSPAAHRVADSRLSSLAVGRHEHVHPRSELHDPRTIAGPRRPRRRPSGRRRAAPGCRRSAARRRSGRRDRSRSRCARCPPPLRAVRRQEPARRVVDACVTRPETGMRLTCTSIGDRKMLICCQSPGGARRAATSPATSTRPSAGDSTSLAVGGRRADRDRGRRTRRTRQSTTKGDRPDRPPATQPTARPRTSAPPMNGTAGRIDPHVAAIWSADRVTTGAGAAAGAPLPLNGIGGPATARQLRRPRCWRRMSSMRSLSCSFRFLRVTSSSCSGSER